MLIIGNIVGDRVGGERVDGRTVLSVQFWYKPETTL